MNDLTKSVYFSNAMDSPTDWLPGQDYLYVVLVPRRWWSWSAWRLALGLRRYVRWGFEAPAAEAFAQHQRRVWKCLTP